MNKALFIQTTFLLAGVIAAEGESDHAKLEHTHQDLVPYLEVRRPIQCVASGIGNAALRTEYYEPTNVLDARDP